MGHNPATLNRDKPDQRPLAGNIKVTKQDWLNAALEILVSDGIERVKILTLAARLGVSRSSFYWYFKSRQDLLDALLNHWLSNNTQSLLRHAAQPKPTVAQGVCHLFLCFVDPDRFNTKLDFAIRDWARRAPKVRRVMEMSDSQRIAAISAMFERFGYTPQESLTRARVLYYMQIGYNDADLQETMDERMKFLPHYLLTFTGQPATDAEVTTFRAKVATLDERKIK